MNIEHLRQSLRTAWLGYYRENRAWLVRLSIWVNYDGQRRPSSSFILAVLSVLEPELTQILPLVVDLSSNPDRIVTALGLNFSPDTELETLVAADNTEEAIKLLPGGDQMPGVAIAPSLSRRLSTIDESCQGIRSTSNRDRS